MALETAALTLLAFPQLWDADAGTLRLRFLCVPLRGPLTALGAGLPNFADANLSFEARLIGSLDHVPRAADVVASLPLNLEAPPLAEGLRCSRSWHGRSTSTPRLRRPRCDRAALPQGCDAELSRRRRQPRAESVSAEGDEFDCALHEAHDSQPPAPLVLKSSLRWGQVLALALRQPRLAEELGLMGEAVITPDAGLFARGGWLYVALDAASDGAGVAGVAVSYAARIPPLAQSPATVCRGAVPDRQGEPRARRHRARCAALRPWPCPDGAWRAGRRRTARSNKPSRKMADPPTRVTRSASHGTTSRWPNG
jgi:hypothetical protein